MCKAFFQFLNCSVFLMIRLRKRRKCITLQPFFFFWTATKDWFILIDISLFHGYILGTKSETLALIKILNLLLLTYEISAIWMIEKNTILTILHSRFKYCIIWLNKYTHTQTTTLNFYYRKNRNLWIKTNWLVFNQKLFNN